MQSLHHIIARGDKKVLRTFARNYERENCLPNSIGWGGYLHNLDLNCSVDRFWRQYSQKPKNLDQLGGGEGGNFDKNYFCSKDFLSQTFIQLEMVFKLYEFLFSQMFFIQKYIIPEEQGGKKQLGHFVFERLLNLTGTLQSKAPNCL